MSTATERQPLTKRQQQVYDFIREHMGKHGRPPTVRQISSSLGGTGSPNASAYHLKALARKGWITVEEYKACGIRLTGDPCPHCGGTGRA